jgi:hypothetical protein
MQDAEQRRPLAVSALLAQVGFASGCRPKRDAGLAWRRGSGPCKWQDEPGQPMFGCKRMALWESDVGGGP